MKFMEAMYLCQIKNQYVVGYMNLKDLLPGLNPWFWIIFFIGLFAITFSYLGFHFDYLPGDMGDTRFNIFLLEHAKQFFGREVDAYWNAGFMFPEAEVISMSDNLLGTAPFFTVFRWFGADLFTSFQLWIIAVTFFNYWASFKLAEHLLKDKRAAAVAAFVFAFSLGLSSQMNHAQTFPRFALPLSMLFLLLWVKDLKTRDFVLAITLLTYQFYSGVYLGFMASVPFLIVFVAGGWPKRHEIIMMLQKKKTLFAYVSAIAFNAWLMFKLFMPYLRRAGHSGLHDFYQISHSIPTLFSYLSAHPGSLIYPKMHGLINGYTAFWDHWIFPGWLVLGGFLAVIMLLLFKMILPQNKFSLVMTPRQSLFFAAGVVTFLIILRIDQFSLYVVMHKIPGFGAMRAMTRIINLELLFMGVSLAFVVSAIIRKLNPKAVWVNLAFALVMALLITENLIDPAKIVRMSKSDVAGRHEALVEKMNHLAPGSIVSYEPDTITDNVIYYQLDAMLAAQALHLKSVNGYSATSAYMFDRYWLLPNTENRLFWFSRFEDFPETEVHVIR